jgi:hypothetical protein
MGSSEEEKEMHSVNDESVRKRRDLPLEKRKQSV